MCAPEVAKSAENISETTKAEPDTDPTSEKKNNEYTLEEVAEHTSYESCWMIIGNSTNGGPKVYDVTKYMDDHPGGAEVLLDVAGKDADEFFEDIGHSTEARKDLQNYYIGDLYMDEETKAKLAAKQEVGAGHSKSPGQALVMLIVVILAVVAGLYLNQE